MNKHVSLFTQQDFERSDYATRSEVVRFWKDFGRPSDQPFWIERIITSIENRTLAPFAFLQGCEILKDYCREVYLRSKETSKVNAL